MASKYLDKTTDPFQTVEQKIRSTFENIIRMVTKKRDQLLTQLSDMKHNYLNREEYRQRELRDLDKLIESLLNTTIQQNKIVKLQDEYIQNLRKDKNKLEQPTQVPFPSFETECLDSLLNHLERLGAIQDIGPYKNKREPVRSIGCEGKDKGELYFPRGITLEGDNIYIADTGNKRIEILSTEGKFITEFGKGHIHSPHDVALCKEWVFVSDSYIDVILKFSKTNYELIGKSVTGELCNPRGITVDRDGEVFVADSDNKRIAVFNIDLKFIREIGKCQISHMTSR